MVGLIEGLVDFVEQVQHDPAIYSLLFFIYTIAATIILPIPVELMLFLSPGTSIVIKALVLGLGKAVGSILVFYIGVNVEGPILKLADKWKFFRKLVAACQLLVTKFGYFGLYIIMSIPLMVDTVPVYLFSIFNKEGTMDVRYFAIVNLAAGITRAAIVYAVFYALGTKLL